MYDSEPEAGKSFRPKRGKRSSQEHFLSSPRSDQLLFEEQSRLGEMDACES